MAPASFSHASALPAMYCAISMRVRMPCARHARHRNAPVVLHLRIQLDARIEHRHLLHRTLHPMTVRR